MNNVLKQGTLLVLGIAFSLALSMANEPLNDSGLMKELFGHTPIEYQLSEIAESTVIFDFKMDSGNKFTVTLACGKNPQEAELLYEKIICPAIPIVTTPIVGDATTVWGVEGSKGGSLRFRDGLMVVGLSSSDLNFRQMIDLAKGIDANLRKMDVNLVQAELRAMISSELLKRAALLAAQNPQKIVKSAEEIAKEVAGLIAKLKTDVKSPQGYQLINELSALGDKSAAPVILEYIGPKYNIHIRLAAIKAMGKLKLQQAVAPLLQVFEQPVTGKNLDDGGNEEILRRTTVAAVEEIGDKSAIPALEKIAADEKEYTTVRGVAKRAITSLNSPPSEE